MVETKNFDNFGHKNNLADISATELLDIYSYFYHYGWDSYTPAKFEE